MSVNGSASIRVVKLHEPGAMTFPAMSATPDPTETVYLALSAMGSPGRMVTVPLATS